MIIKSKLSADPLALILGIISLVIILFGCCCGILAVVSLILSIIGLVSASNSLKEYYSNPEVYSLQSKQNVYAAKIICIIGTIISALFILAFAFVFFIYQISISDVFKEKIEEINNRKVNDSLFYNESINEYNTNDSIYKDSTYVDTVSWK
ncbi:CCC motif membrane protein [Flavobacterium sp.]|uniref:CCC motif membrane protein n=1 Tax=Flavobacterium sp. TaxID=239 RepID=UPI00260D4039|nr:CCC motif membrane protein [Flavobacterium sp.]